LNNFVKSIRQQMDYNSYEIMNILSQWNDLNFSGSMQTINNSFKLLVYQMTRNRECFDSASKDNKW